DAALGKDHRYFFSIDGKPCSDFAADESAADDEEIIPGFGKRLQMAVIFNRAVIDNSFGLKRKLAGSASGGKKKLVIGKLVAAIDHDALSDGIDRRRHSAQVK